MIVAGILMAGIFTAKRLVDQAKLSKAINVTGQTKFIEDDSLVFWIETSNLSKAKTKEESLTKLQDLSKSAILFNSSGTAPKFRDSKTFRGLKAIYFGGSGYLYSSAPLTLSQYTAFIVAIPESASTTNVYNTGIVARVSDLSNTKIVVLKNNGSYKYRKAGNKSKFTSITSYDSLTSRPTYFYFGNGFKGEVLEIIIFDRVLSDKEVLEIEDYLYNKYMR